MANATKAAPAPYMWETRGASHNKYGQPNVYILDGQGHNLAAVWGPWPQRCATAALMAAAPDMRDALIALVDEQVEFMKINGLGDAEQQHNIKRARAALAKSETRL